MSEPFCHDDRNSYVVALGNERESLEIERRPSGRAISDPSIALVFCQDEATTILSSAIELVKIRVQYAVVRADFIHNIWWKHRGKPGDRLGMAWGMRWIGDNVDERRPSRYRFVSRDIPY
jgi:hypothetical protein